MLQRQSLPLLCNDSCSCSLTRQALRRREVLNTVVDRDIADFVLSGVLHWPVYQ